MVEGRSEDDSLNSEWILVNGGGGSSEDWSEGSAQGTFEQGGGGWWSDDWSERSTVSSAAHKGKGGGNADPAAHTHKGKEGGKGTQG